MSDNPHIGSSVQSFFEELGEWEEVHAMAIEKGKEMMNELRMRDSDMPGRDLREEELLDIEVEQVSRLRESRTGPELNGRMVLQMIREIRRSREVIPLYEEQSAQLRRIVTILEQRVTELFDAYTMNSKLLDIAMATLQALKDGASLESAVERLRELAAENIAKKPIT